MLRVDIDDYELGGQLGAGTVGTIFEATRKDTGEVFALKLLSPAVSSNQLIVSRFWREMMILEKLNHPNILAYHGGGRIDDQLFFVMELVRGGTLKQLLSRTGPLSWREAAESARQLASALQHAHNNGIIHRDLKPGNVFVTEQGKLKLGDFGIARDTRAEDITEMGLTVGTYAYMAPELVRGERAITGHVDLYALGCLMFEMLTGRTPYVGDNFAQIFEQHLKSPPPRVAECGVACPQALEDLIVQLLAKDPQDRPFNARTVQGVLGELLELRQDVREDADRAAGAVNLAQQLLSQRISQGNVEQREVTWAKLGWVVAAILAMIVAALLVNR
jgi:serine/threonine protein kinase